MPTLLIMLLLLCPSRPSSSPASDSLQQHALLGVCAVVARAAVDHMALEEDVVGHHQCTQGAHSHTHSAGIHLSTVCTRMGQAAQGRAATWEAGPAEGVGRHHRRTESPPSLQPCRRSSSRHRVMHCGAVLAATQQGKELASVCCCCTSLQPHCAAVQSCQYNQHCDDVHPPKTMQRTFGMKIPLTTSFAGTLADMQLTPIEIACEQESGVVSVDPCVVQLCSMTPCPCRILSKPYTAPAACHYHSFWYLKAPLQVSAWLPFQQLVPTAGDFLYGAAHGT